MATTIQLSYNSVLVSVVILLLKRTLFFKVQNKKYTVKRYIHCIHMDVDINCIYIFRHKEISEKFLILTIQFPCQIFNKIKLSILLLFGNTIFVIISRQRSSYIDPAWWELYQIKELKFCFKVWSWLRSVFLVVHQCWYMLYQIIKLGINRGHWFVKTAKTDSFIQIIYYYLHNLLIYWLIGSRLLWMYMYE